MSVTCPERKVRKSGSKRRVGWRVKWDEGGRHGGGKVFPFVGVFGIPQSYVERSFRKKNIIVLICAECSCDVLPRIHVIMFRWKCTTSSPVAFRCIKSKQRNFKPPGWSSWHASILYIFFWGNCHFSTDTELLLISQQRMKTTKNLKSLDIGTV